MEWVLRGRCWKFGDNITNEEALATSYTHHKDTYDPAKRGDWAYGLLAGVNPDLTKNIKPGDIIVAGKRFAQGNMHWYWIGAMNYYGVGLVTESLPRGQFRNVVEVGLKVIPFFDGITQHVDDGDDLEVDFQKAVVTNHSKGKSLQGKALPQFILEIMDAGGGMAYLKKKRGLA